jgi:hypothetical protein
MKQLLMLLASTLVVAVLLAGPVFAQEQSRESMAVDATATQWSYQFALEGNFDYDTDLVNGVPRGEGGRGFLQFRFVAPVPKSGKIPFTMLPRLTLRALENKDEQWGFGNSDVFVLGIAQQWATGRWGIGPQLNFPSKTGFGNPNWGFGLAGAVTQRALNDKVFLSFLVQQTWSKDPAGSGDIKAGSLGLNPGIVYQLGKGVYIGNGDYVIRYNWNDGSWYVPIRIRLGKAWILPEKTWNAYIEYGTAAKISDWKGPIANHTVRINVQFQLPVALGG